MQMDRYYEYLDWILPDEEEKENTDEVISDKREKYKEYSDKRRKTFASIMDRVQKVKENKGSI